MKGYQTGVLKRSGSKVQKGVSGIKIPVSLWQADENVTDQERVTDVTANSDFHPNRESEFVNSPVTSVTEDQSVTFSQKIEEIGKKEPVKIPNVLFTDLTDGVRIQPTLPMPIGVSIPPQRPCFKCGTQDWQWDAVLEIHTCKGCP